MKKYILRLLVLLPLVISIPACSLHQTGTLLNANEIKASFLPGTWQVEDQIYVLEENNMLGLPSRTDVSGGSWEIKDNALVLSILDAPANPPKEEIWHFYSIKKNRLVMKNATEQDIIWVREEGKAASIEGSFFYLERMALPPEVTLRIDITQSQGTKHVVSSLRQVAGNTPISFKTFYLPEQVNLELPLEISAVIYYNENSIFSTDGLITLENSTQIQAPIRLIRSMPDDASPDLLEAPLAYQWALEEDNITYGAQLFLEPDNLFFLLQSKNNDFSITWGRWNQVGRGHSLELLVHNEEPILAGIRPSGAITFDRLPYFEMPTTLEFEAIPASTNTLTREFSLAGVVKKEGSDIVLIPCGMSKPYIVKGKALEEIKKTLGSLPELSVGLKAQYQRFDTIIANSLVTSQAASLCLENTLIPLTNTYWRLSTLNNKPRLPVPQTELHLIFRNEDPKEENAGEGGGSDGCNSFFFSWETKSNELDIALGGSTMKMCMEEGVSEQGTEYLKTLDEVNNYTIQGSVLELKTDDTVRAVFEAVAL